MEKCKPKPTCQIIQGSTPDIPGIKDEYERRTVSVDKVQLILDSAISLNASSEALASRQRINGTLENVTSETGEVPLKAVSDIATQVYGVSSEIAKRAIELYAPSKEQIREDLRRFNAQPDLEHLENFKNKKYAERLSRSFEATFPSNEVLYGIKYDEDYEASYTIWANIPHTTTKPTFLSRFRKKKSWTETTTEELILADRLEAGHSIRIRNPLFLRACSDTLMKLKEEFGDEKMKITYTYLEEGYPVREQEK